jgi:hypothetical protein
MMTPTEHPTRRHFLQATGAGFGMLALRSLLDNDRLLAAPPASTGVPQLINPLAPRKPHFAPKAKSVIFLFMYGGPSQVDTFDPKPALDKWHGKAIPVFKKEHAFFAETKATAFRSPYKFAKYGQSGIDISDRFPNLAQFADDLCVIRSAHCESNNHAPALFQMNTGSLQAGHPSMGSWVTYGLGSESSNLPAYVVLMDAQGAPVNGQLNWTNGFIPATYQGVPFRSTGSPILNLKLAKGVTPGQQRARLDLIRKWNQRYAAANPGESSLAARTASYELAYRMQMQAPGAVDISTESKSTLNMYGVDRKTT